jgi:cytochrome c553
MPFARLFRLLALVLAACAADAAPLGGRLAPCQSCHGERAVAPGEYYPSLAGKPSGYLYEQMLNFRDGRRHHVIMERMFAYLSDDYLRAMAAIYAARPAEIAPPLTGATLRSLQRGRLLVERGEVNNGVPPCKACHGEELTGAQPYIPGLLGLPRDYLAAQLGAWRQGTRRGRAPDCMAEIAGRLAPDDLAAITAWLASRHPGGRYEPAARAPASLPLECGSVR